MRLHNRDLLAAGLLALSNCAWTLLPIHIPILGLALALPLLFVLPGYLVAETVFHQRPLTLAPLFTLSLGFSILLIIPGGFILNSLPTGLHGFPWAVLLSLWIVLFSFIVAHLRRGQRMPEAHVQKRRFQLTIQATALLCLALFITIFSVDYTASSVAQLPSSNFTQLWALPLTPDGPCCTLQLGVRSFEKTTMYFQIILKANGKQVKYWSPITLTPQVEWEQRVALSPPRAKALFIELLLYRLDKPSRPYREVHLTLAAP